MRRLNTISLCFLFLLSIFVPIASSDTPSYGDFKLKHVGDDATWDYSEHGFFITGGSDCDEPRTGGGLVCDINTGDQLYSYSWYKRFTPMMYNDTILLINGDQNRPDFGEKNEIFGINIDTWTVEFTINSPWSDGGVTQMVKISHNKQYLALLRGSCTQIWDMNTMSNSKLFADYQGESNTYCAGGSSLVGEFSPDSSIYVGNEPGTSNPLSAYSTENWSKLGTVQSMTSGEKGVKAFVFAPDGSFAYYIETGGWDENRRIKNKMFQVDLSVQANLWDQSKYVEFFFGPTALGFNGKFNTFSNQEVTGSSGENWMEIRSLRSIPEYNMFLLGISHEDDSSNRAYPHDGIVLINSAGEVLGELIGDSDSWLDIDSVNVTYLDTDGDGTPDYLDGAPYDPRDTVDSDGDRTGDAADPFPNDPTQYEDQDEDGYGDNRRGNDADLFPNDATQWFDFDGDGYGDNSEGNNPDLFPENSSQWNDSDGDGYGDNPWGEQIDFFPNNPLRWADSDRDGVADEDDDCPNQGDGAIDLDGDGDCEGQDLDDDGDGFRDLMETYCGTFGNNSSSYPPDLDRDWICDDQDTDLDGDNVRNEEDIFPLDGSEWNDLDNDGFGNNSDDCVGNYGTSTLDRLGCLDQDGDGVSDLNDDYPYDPERGYELYDDSVQSSNSASNYVVFAIAIVAILAIAVFGAKKVFRERDHVKEKDGQVTENNDVITTSENVPPTSSDETVAPNYSIHGEQHENGHEVLEFPEGSGKWWWKNYETEQWVFWY